jgi:hypothetical protein
MQTLQSIQASLLGLGKALLEATEAGNLGEVRRLLNAGASVQERNIVRVQKNSPSRCILVQFTFSDWGRCDSCGVQEWQQ